MPVNATPYELPKDGRMVSVWVLPEPIGSYLTHLECEGHGELMVE